MCEHLKSPRISTKQRTINSFYGSTYMMQVILEINAPILMEDLNVNCLTSRNRIETSAQMIELDYSKSI